MNRADAKGQFWRQRHDGSTPARGLPARPADAPPIDERTVQRAIIRLRLKLQGAAR